MTYRPFFRSLCLISLLLSLLLAPSPAQAQAAPPVTVRIAPASVEVSIGQTVEVAVEVIDVQDLYGFDVALTFNPNVVEVVDVDPNEAGVQVALGTFLDSGFAVLNAANNTTGTLRFAMTQLNPSLPKSGTGALIVIRLRGKQVNSGTPLTLTAVQLARRDGTSLATNLVSGQVSVVAASSAPTTTPIPAREPGTLIPTSLPITSASAVGSATVAPTRPPLVTGLAATITPRPIDQPAMTAPGAPTQSSGAPAATNPLPGSVRASETPPTTQATGAPAAVAAVVAPSATPAGVQAAIRVTEQPAAPISSSPAPSVVLLLLSGTLGLIGLMAIVWIIRRRPS